MRPDMNKDIKPYTLSILVQDIPGVLSQVARLFSRKGYNIESIVSGESGDPGVTRITIVLLGDELMISQIAAQCRKLLPVIAVKILDESTSLQREMALIKVKTLDRNARDEVIQMANIFRANIIDVSRETLTVAIFGDRDKTEALVRLLRDFGVLEIARTGTIAIERGRSTIYDDNKIEGGIQLWQKCTMRKTAIIELPQRQEDRHHRLRLPGPRPCPEPEGLRL